MRPPQWKFVLSIQTYPLALLTCALSSKPIYTNVMQLKKTAKAPDTSFLSVQNKALTKSDFTLPCSEDFTKHCYPVMNIYLPALLAPSLQLNVCSQLP